MDSANLHRADKTKVSDVLTKEINKEKFSFCIISGLEYGIRRGERIEHEMVCEISFSNIDRELRGKAIEAAKDFKKALEGIAAEDPAAENIPNFL